ncbi:MAG: extracellular solute-binding protein [Oscillospiraceae bacterium]|nr:extracellular solute-binding protein [Oscillospiraceae bacterium]
MKKKQKNLICKGISAMLATMMLTTVLTGCVKEEADSNGNHSSNSSKSGKTTALDISFDHSYSSETIKIDGLEGFSRVYTVGDNLFISGYDDKYEEKMYLYNMTDNSKREVKLSYLESLDEKTNAYIASYFTDADGNPVFLFNAYIYDEENEEEPYQDLGYTMEVYDKDFNVLETKDMNEVLKDISMNNLISSKDSYYIVSYTEMGEPALDIYDKDFKKTGEVTGDFQYIDNVFATEDKTIVVYQDSNWEYSLGTINPETNAIEKIEISDMPRWFNSASMGAGNYDFFVYDSQATYGINFENGTCEEVVNWINSDFSGDTVGMITALEDGRFIITTYDYGDGSEEAGIYLLKERDQKELENVQLITLATFALSTNLQRAVTKFNRSNSDYRIGVVDYSNYSTDEDYEAGMEKLNNDMLSGVVADIINVDSISYESFANKGMFIDLTDRVSNFNQNEYFTNFFDALKYGDKLYKLGFGFSVQTLEAKTEHVNGKSGLSVAEFTELIKNLPEGMTAFSEMSRSGALYRFLMGNLSAFVDVNNATCNFNTPEFIELLELCATYPEEVNTNMDSFTQDDWEKYWNEQDFQYINDKVLFRDCYISSIKDQIRETVTYFGDADVTKVGYPTVNENSNGGRFQPDYTLAISGNSDMQEQAWKFFEFMLSEDFQESLSWSTPVRIEAFDKKAQQALEPDTYIDENGETQVMPYTIYRGQESVELDMPTQADIDKIKNYITSVTETTYYNEQIYTIIQEEAEKFFSGDQTAQTAVEMIQSRASLYLSEQS